eukprot:m.19574 g.19574  ORF g.19574 m.19574 type:complete len:54 (-) comp5135_c0_seq2:1750-1911(-)
MAMKTVTTLNFIIWLHLQENSLPLNELSGPLPQAYSNTFANLPLFLLVLFPPS